MAKYLQSNVTGLTVPLTGFLSRVTESAERIPLAEVLPAFVEQVEAGDERASIIEVDEAAEAEITAEVEAQLAAAAQSQDDGLYDPTAHNVADVLEYLKGVDADEVARVKDAEAASDRASTQIANYEVPAG